MENETDAMILPCMGFIVEQNYEFEKWEECFDESNLSLIFPHLNQMIYSNGFAQSAHTNYYGSDKGVGPFVLSVPLKPNDEGFQIIVWTGAQGTQQFIIPKSQINWMLGTKNKLKHIKKQLETNYKIKQDTKLNKVEDPLTFAQELIKMEASHVVTNYKIGILYAIQDQLQEEEMFCNNDESPSFREFLDFIGNRVNLFGWKKYRGGLDTKRQFFFFLPFPHFEVKFIL